MSATPTMKRRELTMKRRELTEEQKAAAKARRDTLIARSTPIQTAQRLGLIPWCYFPTTNAALQYIYASEQKQVVWHTLHDWRKMGYRVVKGSEGYPIWSTPQSSKPDSPARGGDSAEGEGEEGPSREHFRLCYLFHRGQVEEIPGEKQEPLSPTIDLEAIERALAQLLAESPSVPDESPEA